MAAKVPISDPGTATAGISVALVILGVFLFLRSGRATLIPAVAVPGTLIGTIAAMYLSGFS
ncbi:efflux RND transporter permease subunit, partial [Enterobacter cloacae complex sp. P10RS]|uniref:efflux RND transporter permease subunit n=1 Tax=Enterobacter cloacae complex sp. P10RS TaxID=2779584 RepID=UPI001D0BE6A0